MKLFKLNDCDYVAAENLEDAKLALAKTIANGVVDAAFEDEYIDEPFELTDKQAEELSLFEEDSKTIIGSFKSVLEQKVEDGEVFPQYFASSEC